MAAHRKNKTRAIEKPLIIYANGIQSSPDRSLEVDLTLQQLAHKLASIFSETALQDARVGFIVSSTKNGQVLAERNADSMLNPASNVKLVTTLAALALLKPEFRFKTEYYAGGPIKNGVLNGNLYVKGFGDPTIVSERLQRVANELMLRGIKSIEGDVVLDDSYFDKDNVPKGWESERYNPSVYAAPIGVLSFNHNIIEMLIRPSADKSASVFQVNPSTEYFRISGQMQTTANKWRPRIQIANDGEWMRVKVSGYVNEKMGLTKIRRRIFNPNRHFGAALIHFLRQQGIRVSSTIQIAKVPGDATLIWQDRSPPLANIIAETNKYSSNFMAEMLVKAIGAKVAVPATFANGLSLIREFLEQEVGLKNGEYVLGNGSGLNNANRFTARQIVSILNYGSRNFEIASEFISSLAVAGTQGTIASRMRDSDAERRLRAKTGTLRNVSALSGYVATQDDEPLAFSILVEGQRAPLSKIWHLQDRIGRSLAQLRALPSLEVEDGEALIDEEAEVDLGENEESALVPGG